MNILKPITFIAVPLWVVLLSLQLEAASFTSDLPLAAPLVLDTNFNELGGTEENRVTPGDTYIDFGLFFFEFGQSDPQFGLMSVTYSDPTRFVKMAFQNPYSVAVLEIGEVSPVVIEATLNGVPVASITTDGGGIGFSSL